MAPQSIKACNCILPTAWVFRLGMTKCWCEALHVWNLFNFQWLQPLSQAGISFFKKSNLEHVWHLLIKCLCGRGPFIWESGKKSAQYRHKPCMLVVLVLDRYRILLDSTFMGSAPEIYTCYDSDPLCWVLCKCLLSCGSIKTAVIICHYEINWFTWATKALVTGLTVIGVTKSSLDIELNHELLPQ